MTVFAILQMNVADDEAFRGNPKYEAYRDAMCGMNIENAIDFGIHEYVALIDVRKLDDVFYNTNNIDEPWTDGDAVLWCVRKRLRSTMVGDIVIDAEDNVYMIDRVGYEKLSGELREKVLAHHRKQRGVK